jgi:hypothetical protein
MSSGPLNTPERLMLLERLQRVRPCLPAAEHPLINQITGELLAPTPGDYRRRAARRTDRGGGR